MASHHLKRSGTDQDVYPASKRPHIGPDVITHTSGKRTLGFMDLPRELRNSVYHYLWCDTPTVYFTMTFARRNLLNFMLRYELRGGRNIHGFPSWIRCSKAMLDEGLEELFRRGHWFCGAVVGYCQLKTWPRPSILMNLDPVKEITYKPSCIRQRWQKDRSAQKLHLDTLDCQDFALIAENSPNLKILRLEVEVDTFSFERYRHNSAEQQDLYLSFLEQANLNLDEFQFTLEKVVENSDPAYYNEVKVAFGKEILRLGRILFNNRFIIYFTEDHGVNENTLALEKEAGLPSSIYTDRRMSWTYTITREH